MANASPSSALSKEALEQRYSVGTRVWLSSKEHVWIPAKVLKYSVDSLECQLDDGSSNTQTLSIKAPEKDLPPLRNPDILIGQNDLTSLSYLHEPAVLYNLNHRFTENNFIYTYCGIVLVAINPYEELPIYGKETVWAYRGHNWGELDPHIFAVAEDAFTQMEREGKDQSIIVSGESGAGKTVSAKYAMRYFATVGGSENETQIERKVLASSPIMEAIGNAKTTRNDNSSRFGKYVELNFDTKFWIIGASMRTYLLEKSRVVFQSEEERNYHIFYQLCASRNSHAEVSELYLDACESFHYTNQGRTNLVIPGVSDEKLFLETVEALTLLGFGLDDRRNFFKLLAAILHLGNVRIQKSDQKAHGVDSSCSIPKDDVHLEHFCNLLQVDFDALRKWLTCRKIVTGKEEFLKPMSPQDAINCRDALSKLLYAEAFAWVVAGVNRSLQCSGNTQRFIGVLDIYGFETFEINSFEQFCINYANEKLQQQFNQHVFKLEQEEYVREEIPWTFIEFYDNQPCIDLIESKLGVLDLLDEECRMPKGSDASWAQKLYQKCGAPGASKHFEKPRMSNTAFVVVHFADRVQYETNGFLEKNKDTVLPDQIATVAASKNTWINMLLEPKEPAPGTKKPGGTMGTAQRKKTVGNQFRESLTLLMQSLNATTPHYVRCIKPNDSKTPFEFDPHRAVQQLRACGVLETIRISAAGFPSRRLYAEFFTRYYMLTRSKDRNTNDLRGTCERIVKELISDEDQYRFGKTKLFFRAGQVAYLEKLRVERMKSSAVVIQKTARGFIYARRFQKTKKAVAGLQRYGRGMLARKLALKLRQTRSAIRIQTCYRRWREQRKYNRMKQHTIGLQARCRGFLARVKCLQLKKEKAAVVLQKWVRGWVQRIRYARAIKNVVIVQSCVRRFLAKRQFKALRTEARSLEHVKQLNKGLENKIFSLQNKIEEMSKNQGQSKKVAKEYEKLKVQLENYKHMEKDLKAAMEKIGELEGLNDKLEEELRKRMDQEVDFVTTKVELEGEVDSLRAELKHVNDRVMGLGGELEDKRKKEEENKKLKNEMMQMEKERETEQQAYQQLLKKVHDMEQMLHTQGENEAAGKANKRPTPVPRRNLAPNSLDSGLPSLDRSPSPTRRALQQGQIPIGCSTPPQDLGLVLVLQQKLKQSEKERDNLEKQLEDQSVTNPDSETRRTQDLIRLQELEMENAKLRDDLNKLRESVDPRAEVHRQLSVMQEELSRKKEEAIQLRTVLASPKGRQLRGSPAADLNGSISNDLDSTPGSKLNGDDEDEIGLILQTQKKIIQQLELELQTEKNDKQEMMSQVKSLESEITKQAQALSHAVSNVMGGADMHLRNEVERLANENLVLRDQVQRLKAQLKRAAERASLNSSALDNTYNPNDSMNSMNNSMLPEPAVFIRKKDQVHMGMLEYRQEDEGKIMRALILDLQPAIALSAQPSGLPAYILFMMIRYTDYINDDNKVRSLLTSAVTYIKRLMRKKSEHLDVTVLWLSNVLRFLHTLKQYSGDAAFQTENTAKQNEQCLKNFDLSEYRQVLSDHAVWIYMMLLKILEQDMQTMIVPAILESTGIDAGASSNSRGNAALQSLIRKLDITYNLLCSYGLDVEVINQVFRQLFYYVCAGALNNLLLRRELCNWSKGLEIRYNVTGLEEWGRSKRMEEVVSQTLSPVIQASKILQARKTDDDVATICDIADSLSIQQVVKLLNLYSSKDGIEADKVSKQFIERVQARLQSTRNVEGDTMQKSKLLMDTQFAFAVKFPFNPSSVQLELINIPDSFGLAQWLKKM